MDTDTTFKYADLDERAQERAREWYSESVGQDWEPELDGFVQCLGWLGFDVSGDSIHYSISWSQGDGAIFSGDWCAESMNLAALTENRPDPTLMRIGAQLMVQFLRFPKSVVKIYERSSGPGLGYMYVEDHDTGTDPQEQNYDVELEQSVKDLAKQLAGWIYTEMRDDLEYQTSDEAVVEGIEANDYDFDEDGRPV